MVQNENSITTLQVSSKNQIKVYPKSGPIEAALIMNGDHIERFIITSDNPVLMGVYLTHFMLDDNCFDDFKQILDNRILCSEIKLKNDFTLTLLR